MARAPVAAILTYHALDTSGSVLATPPHVFAEHMRTLAESGAHVVPLGDVLAALGRPAPPRPVVAITFDDGFQSVYERGFPVLARHGFPATVFVITAHCGLRHAWPVRGSRVSPASLLGWREIREMARAGIGFGSHTETHRDLRRMDARDAEQEMVASKQAIEDALGCPVDAFAYPYGAHDGRLRGLARKHFALACATTLDFVTERSERFALERLDTYYFRRPDALRALFSRGTRAYVTVRRGLRACRGRVSDASA
jgi:peptidoglycan/xylan/chitin deacetylase (PgdA/CDA1 family)